MTTSKSLTTPDPVSKNTQSILEHQRAAFDQLLAVGNACFSPRRRGLPVRPRTNTLLIGPSGSGKTHLAHVVAKELGVDFLPVSVSEWILFGSSARGGMITWPTVFKFLCRNYKSKGAVIFLDELDKINGGSSWDSHLRTEVFTLLDCRIPFGMTDGDGDAVSKESIERAQEMLENRTLILAAGAFQHLWEFEESRSAIGFAGADAAPPKPPGLDALSRTLPRELVNRFRSEIICLPQLRSTDYRRMLDAVGNRVADHQLRKTFLRLAEAEIERAVQNKHGCRFVEEMLLKAIIEERAAQTRKIEVSPATALEFNP